MIFSEEAMQRMKRWVGLTVGRKSRNDVGAVIMIKSEFREK
jgi:hypothetical protein